MKNEERKVYEALKNLGFEYCNGFDYEDNREYAYDHDERCKDDYCRCTSLSPEVTSFDYKGIVERIVSTFEIKNERIITDIESICKTLTLDDFDCDVCGGYYGEELESIRIGNFSILRKLEETIDLVLSRRNKLKKINASVGITTPVRMNVVEVDSKKVEKILIDEYGYLLDSVKNRTFYVIEVDTSDVVLPQKDYAKNLNATKISGYRNRQGICGIVRKVGEKYHVIDGYHRVTAKLKNSKIKLILSK